jgi:predicted O-linked N-acetylglucosamine transferase (SPINDLY family)
LAGNGQTAEAEQSYRDILALFPSNKRALDGLKALQNSKPAASPNQDIQYLIDLYNQGKLKYAADCAAQLIHRYPHIALIYNIAGVANLGLRRLEEALANFDGAIRLKPDYADAHYNRGVVLAGLKRLEEALAAYDEAIRLKPDHAMAYNNRANALADLKRPDEALASFDQAIRLDPNNAQVHNNQGNALQSLRRHEEALAKYETAIRLQPNFADAHNNRGMALADLNRPEAALGGYDAAIRLDPAHAEAHNNRANALKRLNRLDEALASYDEAIRLKPDNAQTHHNRGVILADLQRLDEALASYDAAIGLKPDLAEALTQQMHLRAQMCDWSAPRYAIDFSRLGVEGDVVAPFTVLARIDDPVSHLERAKTWARQHYASAPRPTFPAAKTGAKLKIGYFSADFHDHATMYLMAELFELHDRETFEIHAFSYGKPSQDKMRQRLVDAVDQFHDVRRMTDAQIAAFARRHAIDIAIDLKGYTTHTRSGLFAHGAAPIQIGYLGYPGSMGAHFIDYIIADETLIPEASWAFYAEKVIYLPHSYQVNDRSRDISSQPVDRAALDLPTDGFVFCCFNNSYKITPAEFDIWMRLLTKVEGSVLWLLDDNRWAQAHLRQEATARGIDANRLVFAPRTSLPDHLGRHRCADLFLDTFNYNAHTTASDALWAGLPVVTKLGQGFAARVGGSLLRAIGLDELVTETPDAYEQLALDLATHPDRLAEIRARLAANRMTRPLFDTERFARDIEQAYAMAHARYANGLPPDHIKVADIQRA